MRVIDIMRFLMVLTKLFSNVKRTYLRSKRSRTHEERKLGRERKKSREGGGGGEA